MADSEHVPDPGPIGRPGHGRHCHFESLMLLLRCPGCMVRIDVAYRIHNTEPVYLGLPRELYPFAAANPVEFHLERRAM